MPLSLLDLRRIKALLICIFWLQKWPRTLFSAIIPLWNSMGKHTLHTIDCTIYPLEGLYRLFSVIMKSEECRCRNHFFPGARKWRLSYQSFERLSGNIEVDLNFMFRVPLWPVMTLNSHPVGSYGARGIQVLDIHELAAGKLCALLARQQGRDLFDSHQLLNHEDLEQKRLRLAFVVYGAMNRKDWRTVSLQAVDFAADDLSHRLLPLLRVSSAGADGSPASYGKRLVKECRDGLSVVLPFTDSETEFLNLLLDRGEIVPLLLTSDKDLQKRISRHPLLEWKALNVRQYKGQ